MDIIGLVFFVHMESKALLGNAISTAIPDTKSIIWSG